MDNSLSTRYKAKEDGPSGLLYTSLNYYYKNRRLSVRLLKQVYGLNGQTRHRKQRDYLAPHKYPPSICGELKQYLPYNVAPLQVWIPAKKLS